MQYNELIFKKQNINDFVKNHTHIRYCEAIVFPDGDITYAVPSHEQALIKIYGKSSEELFDIIPIDRDPLQWLMNETNCICIWYNYLRLPDNGITKSQRNSIHRLSESNIISFKFL